MKLVALSDTHSYHRKVEVPDADVFIYAGDITFRGEMDVFADFSNWLRDLPHRYKVIVFGNHEVGTQRGYVREPAIELIEKAGAIYLENSGVEIEGIQIYGSPASPYFNNWEYNYQRGPEIAKVWSKIPTSVNVLITHGPPYGILDNAPKIGLNEHIGCQDLLKRIDELPNLKASVFGHIHRDNNEEPVIRNGVKFINASICTNKYEVETNKPVIFEI